MSDHDNCPLCNDELIDTGVPIYFYACGTSKNDDTGEVILSTDSHVCLQRQLDALKGE